MKKFINSIPLVTYCIIFMLGAFFSWCLLTVSYRNDVFFVLSALLNLVLIILFSIALWKSRDYIELYVQLKWIVRIILCIGGVICLFGSFSIETKQDSFIIAMSFLWTLWACFILRTVKGRYEVGRKQTIKTFLTSGKANIGIVILMFLLIFLSYEEMGYQFKWDGLLYYKSCQNISLGSISSLALYGHISQTYAGIVALFNLVINDVGTTMIVVNIVLLLIAVFAYYHLLKIVIPNKKEIFYILTTTILAFSPYFLGMVNYFSLDFGLICLFPVVLYFTFQEKWIYQMITATLFCFTKETAVIIYAGLCLGIIIVDFCFKKRTTFYEMFKIKHYYTMAIPGVLWLLTFLLLGPWNAGESAVVLDVSYIIKKLEVLYLFQFNWLFTLIILIYLFILLSENKGLLINKYIFPLIMSQFFFTLFSCIFKTVNHPRYIDSSVVFLYCTATYCLAKLMNERRQVIICGIISLVLLISSYKSIDIISNNLFEQIDIGQDKIITTYDLPLGDGAIYNKQMLWMEGAMNKVLKDAIEAEDIIVIPAIDDSTYAFDGASEVADTEGGYIIQSQYWNDTNNRREVLKNENNQEYNIYHISDRADINIIPNPNHKNISYIYIDSVMKNDFKAVLENANIIDEQNYFYRGWVMKRIIVGPKDKIK